MVWRWFSPHAWGCSDFTLTSNATVEVFPTRVGMFRKSGFRSRRRRSFPHTRGDVPCLDLIYPFGKLFSPHAWGCSGHRRLPLRPRDVFPTRVGMFLAVDASPVYYIRFPHTRGDVPKIIAIALVLAAFSPHAWGCSVKRVMSAVQGRVFPTRVGMFR